MINVASVHVPDFLPVNLFRICQCRPPNSPETFEPSYWVAKSGEKGPTINEFSPTYQHQSERSIVISKIFGLNPFFGRLRGLFYPLLTGSRTHVYTYIHLYTVYTVVLCHWVMGQVEIVHFWSIQPPPTSPSPLLGWPSQVDGRRSQQSGYRGKRPSNSESWCHLYSLLDYQNKQPELDM